MYSIQHCALWNLENGVTCCICANELHLIDSEPKIEDTDSWIDAPNVDKDSQIHTDVLVFNEAKL